MQGIVIADERANSFPMWIASIVIMFLTVLHTMWNASTVYLYAFHKKGSDDKDKCFVLCIMTIWHSMPIPKQV